MTAKERDILDGLRQDLHSYHVDVKQLVMRVDSHGERIDGIELDLRGNPHNREENPGVIAQIGDLRKSKRIALSVAAGIWTIITIVFGAVVAWITK